MSDFLSFSLTKSIQKIQVIVKRRKRLLPNYLKNQSLFVTKLSFLVTEYQPLFLSAKIK
jgi:hypothetical protein